MMSKYSIRGYVPTPEQPHEAARLLALNLAHYRAKYGELDFEYLEKMSKAETIDNETAKMLALRMETLIGMFWNIVTRIERDAGAVH